MKSFLFYLAFAFIAAFSTDANAQNCVSTYTTSGPAACDGAAFIDSNIVATNPVWYGNGVVLQTGGNTLFNLCAGTYIVTFLDGTGNSISCTFTISGGSTNPCAGFTAMVSTTDATSASACDGTADVLAYGGSAPYSYAWSNAVTTVSQAGLCVGTYTCTVTDANGCIASSSADVYDANANTIDSLLIFNNNPFPGATIIDSLTTAAIEDCSINYSAVVSASITNSTQIGTDTLQVTWTLFGANGVIITTYTVNYLLTNPSNGVFSATLIVFCSQKSSNYNTIQMTDQVYVQSAGLNEAADNTISVVNPINEEIKISFGENVNASVILMDMSGRILTQETFDNVNYVSMDATELNKGTYILHVNIAGKVSTYKLIK